MLKKNADCDKEMVRLLEEEGQKVATELFELEKKYGEFITHSTNELKNNENVEVKANSTEEEKTDA